MSIIQLKAHDINTASVKLSPLNGVWTVHFSFAQAGVDYSLSKYLGNNSLDTLNAAIYKEYLADYIKSHFNLVIDNKSIPIGSGGIKLGNHQTDIRFFLPSFPKQYNRIFLSIPLFEENPNQHNLIKIKDGLLEGRKILKHSNQFEWEFFYDEEGFRANSSFTSSNFIFAGFSIFVGVIVIALLIIKNIFPDHSK